MTLIQLIRIRIKDLEEQYEIAELAATRIAIKKALEFNRSLLPPAPKPKKRYFI